MKKEDKRIFTICGVAILILIPLIVYEGIKEKNKSVGASYTTQSRVSDEAEVAYKVEQEEEIEDTIFELTTEYAYEKLTSYNKIYNWKNMLVVDNNYEPSKKNFYSNPTLRISCDNIILNSDVYEVLRYRVIENRRAKNRLNNQFFQDSIESVTIKFVLSRGEATFKHKCNNKDSYSFILDKDNSISIYCADNNELELHNFLN